VGHCLFCGVFSFPNVVECCRAEGVANGRCGSVETPRSPAQCSSGFPPPVQNQSLFWRARGAAHCCCSWRLALHKSVWSVGAVRRWRPLPPQPPPSPPPPPPPPLHHHHHLHPAALLSKSTVGYVGQQHMAVLVYTQRSKHTWWWWLVWLR